MIKGRNDKNHRRLLPNVKKRENIIEYENEGEDLNTEMKIDDKNSLKVKNIPDLTKSIVSDKSKTDIDLATTKLGSERKSKIFLHKIDELAKDGKTI